MPFVLCSGLSPNALETVAVLWADRPGLLEREEEEEEEEGNEDNEKAVNFLLLLL